MSKIILKGYQPEILEDSNEAATWLINFMKTDCVFKKVISASKKIEEGSLYINSTSISPTLVFQMRCQEVLRLMSNLRLKQIQELRYSKFKMGWGDIYDNDVIIKGIKTTCKELQDMITKIKKQDDFVGEVLEKASKITKSELAELAECFKFID